MSTTQFRQNLHVPMTVCFMLQTTVLTHTCVYLQNDSSKKAGTCQWRQKILAWISSNHEQDGYWCYWNFLAFRSNVKFWCKQYVRQQRDLTDFFLTGDQTHFAGWIRTVELFELKDLHTVVPTCKMHCNVHVTLAYEQSSSSWTWQHCHTVVLSLSWRNKQSPAFSSEVCSSSSLKPFSKVQNIKVRSLQ
jgi:hypothetical protein